MALKTIGAGWIKKGTKQSFISAQIDMPDETKMKLLIFKNTRKNKENQPDYTISTPIDEEAPQAEAPAESTDAAPATAPAQTSGGIQDGE